MSPDPLIASFRAAGQGQVFAFWDQLGDKERAGLLGQAAEIDLAEITRLSRSLVQPSTGAAAVNWPDYAPSPYEKLPEHGGDAAVWAAAVAAGEAALRAGRVAAFTVAGGQGTRLGYDSPKGTFAVTPVRGRSLFQVFAEKISAAGRRYGRPLHWFIMTSHANHEATAAYFGAHKFFGLDPARVHFFRQGRMPAVDFHGKILLESRADIALSPDGHGGSFRALHRSGALDLLQREGVDILSYFQVDNPLVRCVDPAFIGFHVLRRSGMSSKTLPKAYPEEKVGMFCVRDGRTCVVEYSDMPLALQRERNPDGSLRHHAGSIAIHIIDREFALKMAAEGEGAVLPFHRAEKKIPAIDATGAPVRPTTPNGIKFEMFVFDALPFASAPVVIETSRADDFSPVKNAEGVDSPATCRADQLRQFARWFRAVGVTVPADAQGVPLVALEVSPLFGDDAASFAESWSRLTMKPEIKDGLCLG
ncbi:MAG: UTP--glucose-1-phosphate uridylyltransferase [Opitutales bacterium]